MTKKTPQRGGTHAQRVNRSRGAGKGPPSGSDDDEIDFGEFHFGDDFLPPQEMHEWCQIEMRLLAKETELRARELLDLSTRYAAGQITSEKADELQSRYYHRWGLSLPGVVPPHSVDEPMASDEEIIAQMDKRKERFVTPREKWEASLPGSGRSGDRNR